MLSSFKNHFLNLTRQQIDPQPNSWQYPLIKYLGPYLDLWTKPKKKTANGWQKNKLFVMIKRGRYSCPFKTQWPIFVWNCPKNIWFLSSLPIFRLSEALGFEITFLGRFLRNSFYNNFCMTIWDDLWMTFGWLGRLLDDFQINFWMTLKFQFFSISKMEWPSVFISNVDSIHMSFSQFLICK